MKMGKNELIFKRCSICRNDSAYDKEALKSSTWKINGVKIILCCPCEDDLFLKLLKAKMSKKRMSELIKPLMSDERDEIIDLYYDYTKER